MEGYGEFVGVRPQFCTGFGAGSRTASVGPSFRDFPDDDRAMATLERAIEIAVRAHSGQRDKAGAVYILHPLRVMLHLSSAEAQIAAVLHDVVEDSSITLDSLREEGFSADVLAAIESLSRRDGEDYDAFIERVVQNSVARQVKIADLKDNMDLSRLGRKPSERDLERQAKYAKALERLEADGEPRPATAATIAKGSFSVLIVDRFHYQGDDDYTIDGFPTLELAREFARRWVRDSVEELRKTSQTNEEVRSSWLTFGEDAVVVGQGYAGSFELDFFLEHPATKEERDWHAIRAKLVTLHVGPSQFKI